MQTFVGQHLDSIRIEPDITLFLEYSEPDQGGTRLLHRFYISQDKEIVVEDGYAHDERFQKEKIPAEEVPQQVLKDALDWITQQLESAPSGRIRDVLKSFESTISSL